MDNFKETLGADFWMLRNGTVTPGVEQSLILYGYLVSERVANVEIEMDVNSRKMHYRLHYEPEKNILKTIASDVYKGIIKPRLPNKNTTLDKLGQLVESRFDTQDPAEVLSRVVNAYLKEGGIDMPYEITVEVI